MTAMRRYHNIQASLIPYTSTCAASTKKRSYVLAAYAANISYIVVVVGCFSFLHLNADESLFDRELQTDKSWDFQQQKKVVTM